MVNNSLFHSLKLDLSYIQILSASIRFFFFFFFINIIEIQISLFEIQGFLCLGIHERFDVKVLIWFRIYILIFSTVFCTYRLIQVTILILGRSLNCIINNFINFSAFFSDFTKLTEERNTLVSSPQL